MWVGIITIFRTYIMGCKNFDGNSLSSQNASNTISERQQPDMIPIEA